MKTICCTKNKNTIEIIECCDCNSIIAIFPSGFVASGKKADLLKMLKDWEANNDQF
jgi:hypothetical protein